jgi:hypothetical protein
MLKRGGKNFAQKRLRTAEVGLFSENSFFVADTTAQEFELKHF